MLACAAAQRTDYDSVTPPAQEGRRNGESLQRLRARTCAQTHTSLMHTHIRTHPLALRATVLTRLAGGAAGPWVSLAKGNDSYEVSRLGTLLWY